MPACSDTGRHLLPLNTGAARASRLVAATSETSPVTLPSDHLPLRGLALSLALALGGCSTIENMVAGDKIDYRSSGTKTPGLEVPPDLTQLARDTRYAPTGGAVSASSLQGAAPGPATVQSATTVAPAQIGDVRIERQGYQRWLVTSLTPEQPLALTLYIPVVGRQVRALTTPGRKTLGRPHGQGEATRWSHVAWDLFVAVVAGAGRVREPMAERFGVRLAHGPPRGA